MRRRWKATRPWGRVALVAAVALVLAGVGTGVWWFVGRDSASAATSGTTTTSVAASLTTMEKSVSASGTLTPTVQKNVSFEVSGTVTAVAVAAGDTVTAGETLATVDTLQLNADLLTAKATLATAEAKLADLKHSSNGSTAAKAQIAAAAAQVDVATAAVTTATTALGDATLVAPATGLVTSVGVAVGDRVTGTGSSSSSNSSNSSGAAPAAASSGSTSGSSSAAFVIVGTDAYEVSLSVGDADVAKVAVGDQVEMTSKDLTSTVFGVVGSIGLLSTSTGVAAYPVVVQVTGDVSALHDGVSVDAKVIYQRRTDVLTVPSAAVTTNNDGTTTVTKVAADGTTSVAKVTVGETSGTSTEITAGLAEGDKVQVITYVRTGTGSTGNGQQNQLPQFDPGQLPDFGNGQFPGGQLPRTGGNG